eukprot:m.8933 g.8933  ORF g.8933 m.8933 type:complete len:53 (+) comp5312_c0_seq2:150-308(+)
MLRRAPTRMDYNAQDVAEYEEFRREKAKQEAEVSSSPNKRKLLVAARIGLKK